jgi:hypothetical protein
MISEQRHETTLGCGSWRVCTLVDVSPLLKALEWHLTAQVARDTMQFVEQLHKPIVINGHFNPGGGKTRVPPQFEIH